MRKAEELKGTRTKVSTLLLPSMSGKKANTLSPAIILFQILFITPLKICECRVVEHANSRHNVKTRGISPTLMLVRLVFRMFRLDRRCANSGSYILLLT